MASRKGLVKYGAYVTVIQNPQGAWRTATHEITFMLPPSAEHTDLVFSTATARARKRWRNFFVTETWRY